MTEREEIDMLRRETADLRERMTVLETRVAFGIHATWEQPHGPEGIAVGGGNSPFTSREASFDLDALARLRRQAAY